MVRSGCRTTAEGIFQNRLVTLLEPVMIVIMGLVVGGVVAAVIVPIYQSYGTIGASSGAI